MPSSPPNAKVPSDVELLAPALRFYASRGGAEIAEDFRSLAFEPASAESRDYTSRPWSVNAARLLATTPKDSEPLRHPL